MRLVMSISIRKTAGCSVTHHQQRNYIYAVFQKYKFLFICNNVFFWHLWLTVGIYIFFNLFTYVDS